MGVESFGQAPPPGETVYCGGELRPIVRVGQMPGYPHIDKYHLDLAELIELGGSDNELNIRPAFQNCLAAYCAAHKEKLVLVPELASSQGNKPDGTVRDALRMARGYWEAKDPHDDLDAEIQAKLNHWGENFEGNLSLGRRDRGDRGDEKDSARLSRNLTTENSYLSIL